MYSKVCILVSFLTVTVANAKKKLGILKFCLMEKQACKGMDYSKLVHRLESELWIVYAKEDLLVVHYSSSDVVL